MFSGLYEALNQSVSAVLPETSPNASPTRPPLGQDSPSSPRNSMGGRDPTSPPPFRSNTLNGNGGGDAAGGHAAGYSTYQPRRNKPSLEDRLRASLAAKEQKRVVSERERDGAAPPVVMEEGRISSPVANGPPTNLGFGAGNAVSRPQQMQPHNGAGELDRARNIALPLSPPLQNATPFLSTVPEKGEEVPGVAVDIDKELPQAFSGSKGHTQMKESIHPPEETTTQQANPPQEARPPEKPTELLGIPEPIPPPPAQVQDLAPLPVASDVQESVEPLQTSKYLQDPLENSETQTITVPPTPPSKYDDPTPSTYDDPLTPALLELEREQQVAATKARLPRSPQPKYPQMQHAQFQSQPGSPQPATLPPTPSLSGLPSTTSFTTLTQPAVSSGAGLSRSPTKQQFGHGRGKSVVPEGEPFIRFSGSSSGSGSFQLGTSFSLEQVLRKPGVLDGLGLEGVHDEEGLKAWVKNVREKANTSQEEVSRLHAKLLQQDSRMEELRDTRRLESLSQSELVESLRQRNQELSQHLTSLETSLGAERSLLSAERSTRESFIAAERAKNGTALSDLDTLKQRLRQQEEENERLTAVAKEEEEKRTKAISLLKTVRTKLVKAEKDREDAVKELAALRENIGVGERGREEELRSARNELERVRGELERTRVEGSREVERVREDSLREFERGRAVLENEMNSLRDAMEREVLARRGEWEIEGIAAKTAHQKEVANLNSRISTLSVSLNQLTDEKSALFSDLQFRTSDLEAARTQLEDLQSQLIEANYQLREREEQLTVMQVELSEARRNSAAGSGLTEGAGPRGPEVAHLLAAAESRSEARVLDLRSRLRTIEAERAEQEETWTRSLAARTEEIERLRDLLGARETEGRRVEDYKVVKEREVQELEEKVRAVEGERAELKRRLKGVEGESESLREKIEGRDEELRDLKQRVDGLMGSLEEVRGKEAQLKLSNKTLREELRKVQSSAALLERQRNPGVGYWGASGPRTPLNGATFSDAMTSSSTPDLSRTAAASSQGRPGTPVTPASAVNSGRGRAPSTAGSARSSMEVNGSVQGDEEVNLEYLRNVILQFLEHEKMRPNLVRVLSVILRFTPQETRRLIAKV